MGIILFSFVFFQLDLQIAKPSGQGSPIFLPLQKEPYLAFQINTLGSMKNREDGVAVMSGRDPNKVCSSYHNEELHFAQMGARNTLLNPWTIIQN